MSAKPPSYGGRYEVLEKIGSGGMAEVYRARDDLLGREVALKVLSERFARDRSFVERFRREAQSAANLNHPNIVSLYDYGSDDNAYYIVMEYIDGRTLSDLIRHEGPLLAERAAEICADVARALGKAHANGIVHRDVKPGNIMITSSGQTKVTDFGIARAVTGNGDQTMTQTGMVMGTASYLSPEQAQGSPVDARSDVYSLGIVLYEMLTGAPPFKGDTPIAIAYKHVRETATVPSRVNPDVPAPLDAIVMKALAKNPENRYTSAAEMQGDLERFLGGQKVLATPLLEDQTAVAPALDESTAILRDAAHREEARGRTGWYALSALAILIIFGVIAWVLFDSLVGGEPVEVPRLIGMTEREATAELDEIGLEADPQDRRSQAPVGQVFDQDPNPGETINEGDSVTIFVSLGPQQVLVPSVIDMKLDEAEETLRDAKLKVGDVEERPDEADPGTVLDQEPDPGEQVDRGTRVNLVVSAGPEKVEVPGVEGLSEEDAVEAIRDAGLVPDVDSAPSDEVEEGFVISQDPAEGTEAERGDTVRILVSSGPEEQEMPDVRGDDADDAEALLESEYGLDVSREDALCNLPPGRVCDQDPDPGTPVEPGDDAILYVQPGGESSLPQGFALALILPLIPLSLRVLRHRQRG